MEKFTEEGENDEIVLKPRELVSYKGKLLGFNGVQYAESEKDEMQLENLKQVEVDEVEEDKKESNEIYDDLACPTLRLIS